MDISIIICTYNPTEQVFGRCLAAVRNFKRNDLQVEILLIDNNSSTPLNEINYIKAFLSGCSNATYTREIKPGLTYARICGYSNATAPIIIFFDDDNEPDENYLIHVHQVFSQKPGVGMIGPGNIHVEYTDGSNQWLETKRRIFQERTMLTEAYAAETSSYKEFYPYGTGLAVRREVMKEYCTIVLANGEISDRKAGSLISGGDAQIVWSGIKIGYAAGSTPLLKINHLIPKSRTSEAYIKKLHYSLGYSDIKTYLGVFPEKATLMRQKKRSFSNFSFILIKCITRNLFNRKLLTTELLPSLLGKTAGYYYAFNEKQPWWLSLSEKLFDVNYYN